MTNVFECQNCGEMVPIKERPADLKPDQMHVSVAHICPTPKQMRSQIVTQQARIAELEAWEKHVKAASTQTEDHIQQVLGKALGYPWFKDDPKNFPGATEEQGVCVGDNVSASLADQAARRIAELEGALSDAIDAIDDPWCLDAIRARKALKGGEA